MGLMYIFPVTDDAAEGDRAEVKNETLTLRTYGLPMIFWGYLAATLSVIFLMWIASRAVIEKVFTYDDPLLLLIGYSVKYLLYFSPIFLLGFFFYEKTLSKKDLKLTLGYRLFFITFWKKHYHLKSKDSFKVEHFMDSPNMAKIRHQQGIGDIDSMKHFENKGYFELKLIDDKDRIIPIDRHSRKVDLLKIKDLLAKY